MKVLKRGLRQSNYSLVNNWGNYGIPHRFLLDWTFDDCREVAGKELTILDAGFYGDNPDRRKFDGRFISSDIPRILQVWWRGLWWKRARRKFDYINMVGQLLSVFQFLLRLSDYYSSTVETVRAVCGLYVGAYWLERCYGWLTIVVNSQR